MSDFWRVVWSLVGVVASPEAPPGAIAGLIGTFEGDCKERSDQKVGCHDVLVVEALLVLGRLLENDFIGFVGVMEEFWSQDVPERDHSVLVHVRGVALEALKDQVCLEVLIEVLLEVLVFHLLSLVLRHLVPSHQTRRKVSLELVLFDLPLVGLEALVIFITRQRLSLAAVHCWLLRSGLELFDVKLVVLVVEADHLVFSSLLLLWVSI